MYINKNIFDINKKGLTLTHRKDKIKVLFDQEDYKKIKQYHWRISQKRDKLYVCTGQSKNGGKIIYLHNVIMNFTPDDVHEIDHKNSNSLDNRKENLRKISRIDNIQNVSVRSDNKTTGIRGVSFSTRDNLYKVDFAYNKKRFYLKPMKELGHAVYLRYLLENKFLGEFRSTSNDTLIFEIIDNMSLGDKNIIQEYFESKVS